MNATLTFSGLARASSFSRIVFGDSPEWLAILFPRGDHFPGGTMLDVGQLVRVNLAGLQAEGVMFQAAVTDAVGHIVKQTSAEPPRYLVKLLFSFRGVTEVEVPAERIHANK
jgi:hypothetical protein